MNEYLEYIKWAVDSKTRASSVTVIMGNESCDLDSAVSSLVYGYFRHWIYKNNTSSGLPPRDNFHLYIPLLNIRKCDLAIKTEVVYQLKKYNIDLNNVLCMDDVNFKSMIDATNECFKIILVDHHMMDKNFSYFIKYVTEIFDHRPKDAMWKYGDNVKTVMSNVGSCSTLICAEILHTDNGTSFLLKNTTAAFFLYGTIILDTINFLPSADKAKPLDFEMTKKLEEILNIQDGESHRKKLFDSLLAARTDYSSLNSLQLLSKDLKIVNGFPVCGLPLQVTDFLKRDDVISSMEKFCEDHNANTILIMGLVTIDNEVKRDIAVFTVGDGEVFNKVIHSLQEATDPLLELEQLPCNVNNCVYFQQKNVTVSRKQIIPILKSAIKN